MGEKPVSSVNSVITTFIWSIFAKQKCGSFGWPRLFYTEKACREGDLVTCHNNSFSGVEALRTKNQRFEVRRAVTGLQLWNAARDVENIEEYINETWVNFLLNDKRMFVIGGNDAHGDFSHTDNNHMFTSSEDAFGKVRTYIYSTSGLTEEGILYALRNGHSIMTDGPLVTFTVYDYTTGVEEIIGNTLQVGRDTNLGIDIRGASSPEFGSTITYTLKYGTIGDIERDVVTKSFDAYPDGLDWIYINLGDYPMFNKAGYFRIEASTTDSNGIVHRAYTNPIWIEVEPYVCYAQQGGVSALGNVGALADCTPPSTPSLISPSNGYVTNNPAITFTWTAATDADSGVKDYQIQIDNNNDFSSPNRDLFVTGTSYSTTLSDGTYYWRVRARDNADNLGSWSTETRGFIIALGGYRGV